MASPGGKPPVPTKPRHLSGSQYASESSNLSVARPVPRQHIVNDPPTKRIPISSPEPSLPTCAVTPSEPSPRESQPKNVLSDDEDCPCGQGEYHRPQSRPTPPAIPPKPPGLSSTSATTAVSKVKATFEHQEEGPRQLQSGLMMLSERREPKQGALSSALQQLASHGKHAISAVRKELFPSRGQKHKTGAKKALKAEDFVTACKVLLEYLKTLNEDFTFVRDEELLQTQQQFEERKILISMFGRFNGGKSTLLNAILEDEILPMKKTPETTVKVHIKHDKKIHRGPCLEKEDTDPKIEPCAKCPYLMIQSTIPQQPETTYKGAKCIETTLENINHTAREKRVPAVYTLCANVPLISSAPEGWNVFLVDNPGFAETNESVNELAEMAMKSSSAYVYIVQCTQLRDVVDAGAFRLIHKKDSTIFRDKRLVIAATYFDKCCPPKKDRTSRIPPEEIKSKICETIHEEVGEVFSEDMVIPVSGLWARAARLLKHNTKSDKYRKMVLKCLEGYDEGPAGQGERNETQPSLYLATKLEEASGLIKLEESIRRMADGCFEVWVHTITSDCKRYMNEAMKVLEERIEGTVAVTRGQEERLEVLTILEAELVKYQQNLEDNTSGKKSDAYKALAAQYDEDIESADSSGRRKAEKCLQDFKEQCASAEYTYTKSEFESAVETFLGDTSKQLEDVYGSARFERMCNVLAGLVGEMGAVIGSLRTTTHRFCNIKRTDSVVSHEKRLMEEEETLQQVIMEKAPNLKELKNELKVEKLIPRVDSESVQEKLSKQTIEKALADLEKVVSDGCSRYFTALRQPIIEHFYNQYCARVKTRVEEYDAQFQPFLRTRRQDMKMLQENIQGQQEFLGALTKHQQDLDSLKQHIQRKAEDYTRKAQK